jgi:hypothetical protein
VCRSKHVEQLGNIGIINSTTQSHLVSYFYMIDKGWSFGMGIESGPNSSLTIVMKCYTDIQTSNSGGLL